jgi:hypothetical protein
MTPALTFSALSTKGPSAEPLYGEESGCRSPIVVVDGSAAVRSSDGDPRVRALPPERAREAYYQCRKSCCPFGPLQEYGAPMEKDELQRAVENAVLAALETSLQAQLNAIKRLRSGASDKPPAPRKRTSQVDLVRDVLRRAGKPLHITEIIEQVEKANAVKLDRESIVSSLVKKVNRGDSFIRTDKNIFALKEEK